MPRHLIGIDPDALNQKDNLYRRAIYYSHPYFVDDLFDYFIELIKDQKK